MHFDWLSIINIVAQLAVPVLGAWILKKLTGPVELARAQQLALIAKSAAALVVSLNPKGEWALLLQQVIAQISNAAGLPTSNVAAIQRAAALALTEAGVSPPK